MRRSDRSRCYLLGLLALAAAAGCDSGNGGQAVSGQVVVGGTPVAKGVVRFVPRDQGPSSGSPIKDGKFAIAADKGPLPGEYDVKIEAEKGTGKMLPMPGVEGETYEETIPLASATRQVTVSAGGENEYTFELEEN